MTLSADEDEHDVICWLFTSFETGKIVR